jgi:hypothetical protein
VRAHPPRDTPSKACPLLLKGRSVTYVSGMWRVTYVSGRTTYADNADCKFQIDDLLPD